MGPWVREGLGFIHLVRRTEPRATDLFFSMPLRSILLLTATDRAGLCESEGEGDGNGEGEG